MSSRRRTWIGMPGTVAMELEVEFRSSGFHEPATFDRPAEGEDERTVTGVYLFGHKLPAELARQLAIVGGAEWTEALHQAAIPVGLTDKQLRAEARAERAEARREEGAA